MYTVKISYFPSPAGMWLIKLWLGNNLLFPARESLVCVIPAGDGKIAIFLYSVSLYLQCM
jgi:hypothetical protein